MGNFSLFTVWFLKDKSNPQTFMPLGLMLL